MVSCKIYDNIILVNTKNSVFHLLQEKYGILQRLIVDRYDIQTYVHKVDGKLYLRVSTQIYNTFQDYVKLANAVLDLVAENWPRDMDWLRDSDWPRDMDWLRDSNWPRDSDLATKTTWPSRQLNDQVTVTSRQRPRDRLN